MSPTDFTTMPEVTWYVKTGSVRWTTGLVGTGSSAVRVSHERKSIWHVQAMNNLFVETLIIVPGGYQQAVDVATNLSGALEVLVEANMKADEAKDTVNRYIAALKQRGSQ